MTRTPGNLVNVLSKTLAEFTQINDQRVSTEAHEREPCCFEAFKAPPIGVRDYFHRIDRYSNASEECYICALILIDRLIHQNPRIYLTSYNVHRLLVTAVMIAAKGRDDIYYSNKYYASVGGITLPEMNYLEHEFLKLVDFDLFVSLDDYVTYLQEISTRYGPLSGKSAQYLATAAERQRSQQGQRGAGGDTDMADESASPSGSASLEDAASGDGSTAADGDGDCAMGGT